MRLLRTDTVTGQRHRRILSYLPILAVVATVLVAAACQKETVTKVVTATPETEATSEPTHEPTRKPQPTPKPAEPKIGETLQTDDGDTFSVYIMLRNFEGSEYWTPDPGREWVAFDLETCSSADTEDLSVNPYYWSLKLADNTNADQAFGGMEPQLHSEDLFPGDCSRGWVTFDIPAGAALDSIRLDDFAHKAKWDIE